VQIIERVKEENHFVGEPEIRRKLIEWIEANLMIFVDRAYLSPALS
jgi:hypothetical protein